MADEKPQEKQHEKPKPAAARPAAKRTKKIVEAEGIAHITATFNNTLITICDMQGNAITWGSSGKAGFKGSKKSTPFAATVAAEQAAREPLNLGVKRVNVRMQSPGAGRPRNGGSSMSRYTGPVCRLCRREGTKLFLKGRRCLTEKCAGERSAYAPGQHGQSTGRR